MRVRVVITCWPDFVHCATRSMRDSLAHFGGAELLDELDKSKNQEYRGKSFIRNGVEYIVYPSSHCYISTSRNCGANCWNNDQKKRQVIDDCDGILFMDSDHTFTIENIEKLIADNVPIVGAAYPYRSEIPPYSNCYVAGDLDPKLDGNFSNRIHRTEIGLQKCGWLGGGFLYVKSSTFTLLEYPWFRRGVIDNGDTAEELGEDVGFCLQAAKANIPVYCDCDCIVAHGKD